MFQDFNTHHVKNNLSDAMIHNTRLPQDQIIRVSDLQLNTVPGKKSRKGSDATTVEEPVDLNSFATKKTASAGHGRKCFYI